jgi:hypothetical protein
MAAAQSAACILGLSQEVLRVWIDEDVGEALGRLTRMFVLLFVELLRGRAGDIDRITVQTAIAHLHVAHVLGSGLGDGKVVRDSMLALLDDMQIPPPQADTLQVRSKLLNAITKMLTSVTAADGLELDPATMLTTWSKKRHRAAKL